MVCYRKPYVSFTKKVWLILNFLLSVYKYLCRMNVVGMNERQKTHLDSGMSLPVMEQFYTLQGEGFFTGKAAYFVRIGGCDVGCHWCDVKESWNAAIHPLIDVSQVVSNCANQPAKTIVITGGEPLMYNMEPLTAKLHENGLNIHLETSGAYALTGTFDWICLSPKKTSPPLAEFYLQANELKMIIHNRHDFEWAEVYAAKVGNGCKLYLQPEWSKRAEMMPIIVDYVMKNPKWAISLQTHKYLNIP